MNAIVEQLGWTLMHSLWQLAALAVALMLLLRLLQQASAQSRYLAASVTLLLMAIALPATFIMQPPSPTLTSLTEPVATSIPTEPVVRFQASAEPVSPSQATPSQTSAPQPKTAWRQRATDAIRPWLMTIVVVWLVGVALLSLRPLAGWRAVRRLRTVGTSPASPAAIELSQRCAQRLGVFDAVEVVQSTLVEVPAVVGWLRPMILLPIGIASGLTPMQLEAVLAHELAHVRRRDYLVNLLQTIVETLLFYHPAVWWVSRQMRLEREDCCDDLALTVCPDRRDYARTLLTLDEMRMPLPAVAMSGGSLLARVRRIVLGSSTAPQTPSIWGTIGLVCVVLAVVYSSYIEPSPTFADEPERAIAATEDKLGTLSGRFTIEGPVPKPVPIPIYGPALREPTPLRFAEGPLGTVPDESLVVNADGRLANVLIYVTSPHAPQTVDGLSQQVKLRALDRRFQPHMTAIHASQSLLVENLDPESVSVHFQGLQNQVNRLLPPRSDIALQLKPEKLPTPVTCNVHPWMKSWLFVHANPFHAVSQADGTFEITGLPPGEWEFRAWHERCGYLNTEDWPKGRFTRQIKGGQNDLGEIKLPGSLLAKIEKPVPPQGTAPQSATADPWFWPDPYSHMGHDELLGLGWLYVRIALDDLAGEDLQTTREQRQAIVEIMRDYNQRAIELGKKLAEEGIDVPTRLARRKELWLTARDDARKQLSPKQHERVEQLMIQRQSYSAFTKSDLPARLVLSDDQQQRIKAAIAAHIQRIKDEDLELEASAKQAQGTPLEDHLLKLRAAKDHRGRLSHRRVWEEIREIFTPQQREQFVQLRGPMAEPARKKLPHFEPMPPARNTSLR